MDEADQCTTIITSLEAELACLMDKSTSDRPKKKRALETVKSKALESAPADAVSSIFDSILNILLVCTESDIESIREQAAKLLQGFASRILQMTPQSRKMLIKTALIRTNKTEETVEEARSTWIGLARDILDRHVTFDKIKNADLEDYIQLIQLTVSDPFPEVQRKGAKVLDSLARQQPRSMRLLGERGVLVAIPLLTHKHAAVRDLGVKAVQNVLLVSTQGLSKLFESPFDASQTAVIPGLMYDTSAKVRNQLYQTMGELLIQWPPNERYTRAGLLLPLLLAGTSDELDSVRETSRLMLKQLGVICALDLVDAGISETAPTWQAGLEHLVHQCFSECLNSLIRDSNDFIEAKQATVLNALNLFLEYAPEGDIVRSLTKLTMHLIVLNSSDEDTAKGMEIVNTLRSKINPEVIVDVLLSHIDQKRLATESSGLPGKTIISVVFSIFDVLLTEIETPQISPQVLSKVLTAIERPYIRQYRSDTAEKHAIALRKIAIKHL